MNMRFAVAMSFCVLFGLVAEGHPQSAKIVGDTLVWWPRDFRGEAVVPSDVRHIGSDAFSSCVELTSVSFPECLETIGSLAFSGCDRLGEVNVPASVTNIGRSAFFNCRTLTNVVIRAKIRMLPDNLCSLCFGLSHVELPDGLSEICDMAFRGCRSLHNIDIPSSVRRFGRGAFVGCSRLSGVELPRCMETVDDFAFHGCYDLKRLVLHSVPKKIGTGAFRDCHSLKAYVLSVVPGSNALYSVRTDSEISVESICKDEGHAGSYGTFEDAFLAADKMYSAESDREGLDGLEQTLRIAADGMVDELLDVCYPVGTIDSLAANLFKLSAKDDALKIKAYFKRYSSSSVDSGNVLVADLSVPGDITITVKFSDDRLSEISLSDGLKNVISRRLKRKNESADESVVKWLK